MRLLQINAREPGHDINVTGVWEANITGEGVVVAVVDDGMPHTHTHSTFSLSLSLSLSLS